MTALKRRLAVNRETLRSLTGPELGAADGGASTPASGQDCLTTFTHLCPLWYSLRMCRLSPGC